ncbi:hypothetical protein C8Q80DRAFT_1167084 [Daedaleopsis nitida]|nr:hypothetical protein C8Q80DRAFT_1167084 [Daedaleopsis nitida]
MAPCRPPQFQIRGCSNPVLTAPVVCKRLGRPLPFERRASLWEIADHLHRALWTDSVNKGDVVDLSRREDEPITIIWRVVECDEDEDDDEKLNGDDVKVEANPPVSGSTSPHLHQEDKQPVERGPVSAAGNDIITSGSAVYQSTLQAISEPDVPPMDEQSSKPSGVQPWECAAVKALFERRSKNVKLSSTSSQGLSALSECAKSLGWELTAYRCERAINEICVRVKAEPVFSPKPKRLTVIRPPVGFAGVVEDGTLSCVNSSDKSSAQATLSRLRAELNIRCGKQVQTVPELSAS